MDNYCSFHAISSFSEAATLPLSVLPLKMAYIDLERCKMMRKITYLVDIRRWYSDCILASKCAYPVCQTDFPNDLTSIYIVADADLPLEFDQSAEM